MASDEQTKSFLEGLLALVRKLYGDIVALIQRSFHWGVNPDGTIDGHYPNGDKDPTPATASWGDLSALAASIAQQTVGTPFSQDIRTYLTGTAALTATLSVETFSGDDAIAEGWAISGNNLIHPGDNGGSGELRLGATVGGNTVYTSPLAWIWLASAPTDTLAPTVPRRTSGTPGAAQIEWTGDAPTDAHDGTDNGSGVAEIDIELNGNVTTIPVASGLTSAYTLYSIGAPSPAPDAVQDGVDWDITAEGMMNLAGGVDRGCLLGRTLSGDFTIACYVPAFAGSSAGPRAGIHIRESLDVGARFLTAQLRVLDTDSRLNVRSRSSAGGTTATAADLTGVTAAHIRVTRVGTTFSVEYSTDNATWNVAASLTLALPTEIYVGFDVTSQVNGVAKAVTLEQCSLTNAPAWSYTQSTVSSTRARVRARDVSGNVSAYGPLTPFVTPSVTTPAVKWNPGWYLTEVNPSDWDPANVVEIKNISNIKGWMQYIRWNQIESNTVKGSYDWTFFDEVVETCRANNKRLVVCVLDRTFAGAGGPNPIPAYMANESGAAGGWYVKSGGSVQAKIYLSAVMDRILALRTAIGVRYNSEHIFEGLVFPSESSLQGIGDTSSGGPSDPNDPNKYSEAKYKAQYARLITGTSAALPNTNFWLGWNSGFSSTSAYDLAALMAANRCGACGPDVATSSTLDASISLDRVLRGLIQNGSNWISGGIDYRQTIPIAHEWEGPELGGKERGWSLAQLYAHMFNTNMDQHAFVRRKNFTATRGGATPEYDDIYWDNTKSYATNPRSDSTDLKTFMTSISFPTRQTVPSVYSSVVTGG